MLRNYLSLKRMIISNASQRVLPERPFYGGTCGGLSSLFLYQLLPAASSRQVAPHEVLRTAIVECGLQFGSTVVILTAFILSLLKPQ